jgi:hypothetical protein
MQLSPHFKLEEFTQSPTAKKLGIKNEPSAVGVALARELCVNILEPIRAKFGAVKITSGFRCHELNTAVGGSATSDHCWDEFGVASDIQLKEKLQVVFDWIRLESSLPFDQCILERGKVKDSEGDDCIHISLRPTPRRMALLGPTHGQGKYTPQEVI